MVRVLHHLNADAAASLAAEFPSVEFISIPRDGTLDADVAGDVLVTSPVSTPTLAEALSRGVQWVHLIGTGVDRFPLDLLAPEVTLSCSRGGSCALHHSTCSAYAAASSSVVGRPAQRPAEGTVFWNPR